MLESIPIPEPNLGRIQYTTLESIPELDPGSESTLKSEPSWESQFAQATESELTPELEMAAK